MPRGSFEKFARSSPESEDRESRCESDQILVLEELVYGDFARVLSEDGCVVVRVGDLYVAQSRHPVRKFGKTPPGGQVAPAVASKLSMLGHMSIPPVSLACTVDRNR